MIISILGLLYSAIYSQSRFGIDVSFAHFETQNAGQLTGGGEPFVYYRIDAERNTITSSYSIGFLYKVSDEHVFKLSFGRHHNGRILDLSAFSDDFSGPYVYTDVNLPYQYFQIEPSYTYRAVIRRMFIPIQLGLNINRRINEEDIFFVGIRKMNYDVSISTGLGYIVTDYLSAAIKGVYNQALNEYQSMYEEGTYKPKQFGLGISLMYQLARRETSE